MKKYLVLIALLVIFAACGAYENSSAAQDANIHEVAGVQSQLIGR